MRNTLQTKLLMSAAVAALSLGATQAFASGGADTQWATVDNHGFLGIDLMAQGGYNFGSGDLTYAQINDGVGGINQSTKVDLGDGFNGKVGIAGRFEGGWKFGLNYSGIRSDKTGDTGTYNALNTATTYPVWNVLGNSTTSYNAISVSTSSKVDMLDLTVGYDVGLGGADTLVVTTGVRYGQFNQTTNTDIWLKTGLAARAYEFSDQLESEYKGYGPLIGASYTAPVTDNGFGVFGSALGGVLFGKQTTSRTDNISGGHSSSTSNRHVAYTAETEAGVSYKLPSNPATISVGYQLSYFDKVRDTTNGTGATGTESYGNSKDSMLYHGPFARLVISLP